MDDAGRVATNGSFHRQLLSVIGQRPEQQPETVVATEFTFQAAGRGAVLVALRPPLL